MQSRLSGIEALTLSRRRLLALSAAGLGVAGAAIANVELADPEPDISPARRPAGYDPWIEILGDAFRNNVREASRLASGRPILAVVKNNGYGLGDQTVGPLLADLPEVGGVACVRPAEALAMREAGIKKPILVMAVCSEEEMAELARHNVTTTVWGDDAGAIIGKAANRLGRPIPVELLVDTGMNREGMPFERARPWIEELVRSEYADVVGTYTMFAHDLDFDRVQFARFMDIRRWASDRKLPLGRLHAAPTIELFHYPESHLDMVRPGNALFGNYPSGDKARDMAALQTVYRLCCRVVRVERIEAGASAGFYRNFKPERPTWVALLPIGRTDGYPSSAQGRCEVLIGGRLYPVMGGVNSAHTIIEVGEEPTVRVGDIATLVGPDHDAIGPEEIARRTDGRVLPLMQNMNSRLPRLLV